MDPAAGLVCSLIKKTQRSVGPCKQGALCLRRTKQAPADGHNLRVPALDLLTIASLFYKRHIKIGLSMAGPVLWVHVLQGLSG